MKQVLIRRGQVAVENVPAPLVEGGYVLVEVAYSLISTGTETSSVESSGKSLVKRALERPDLVQQVMDYLRKQGIRKTVARVKGQVAAASPTGYSCSGFVIQVGKGVEGFHPGDRVACAGAGQANHAEIVLVPSNLVTKVPEGCDLKDAASVTLGAIAMQGVRRADPRFGEIVAVVGLGLLGQLTVQLLKAAGCQVIGFDLESQRASMARDLGADYVFIPSEVEIKNEIRHLTADRGVDATIITATSSGDSIVQQAMEMTRKKGRVVVVGAVGLGLKRSPFYEKEIDFLISCSYGPGRYDEVYEKKGVDYPFAYVRWTENRNMAEYLRLVADGKVKVKPILEREYAIEDAPLAYDELRNAPEKPLGALISYEIAENDEQRVVKLPTKVTLRAFKPSGRINVALVGAGNFAKAMHLPNLKELSDLYHLRAIVSGTGSNALATAQQFGADYASTNYREILDDPEVNAVVIANRHHLHAEQVSMALRAGKHVFCEKPLALSFDELNNLMAFYGELPDTDSYGIYAISKLLPILMVGYNRRFSPAAQRVKQVVLNRHNPLMVMFRVNAGYIPPESWIQGPEGGGRILGEMCHMIDLFQYWVGASVKSVSIQTLSSPQEHLLSSDNLTAAIGYADGSVCTLVYSALGNSSVSKEYIEVFIDGKTLVIDDFKKYFSYGASNANWAGPMPDKGHRQALEAFGNSIKLGSEWPIGWEELVETSKITLMIAESLNSQAPSV